MRRVVRYKANGDRALSSKGNKELIDKVAALASRPKKERALTALACGGLCATKKQMKTERLF